ncbi:hypothetical protein BN971_03727 [Mycobacterium bohemicum DSM 44277]|uniref:Uncharacterized protein n=1 Tax=Mycobacterium bohemicum DSM 44277 TaxID=1236609 RepID=A0A0U0WBT3_MYCBE|nr:hypothetical protein [Mycobacterium bohemicum]MCV6968864.1 hypothetical protein [Mycobacterium bohemicum]CPR12428.1 hypothetical protein BN971_03727 [Mycobacterium bohemicum DSM 44277]
MSTHTKEERPGRRNDRAQPTQGDSEPPESESTISRRDDRYTADARWCANLQRIAERAAREPQFYEIAGRAAQAMADDIKAGL